MTQSLDQKLFLYMLCCTHVTRKPMMALPETPRARRVGGQYIPLHIPYTHFPTVPGWTAESTLSSAST